MSVSRFITAKTFSLQILLIVEEHILDELNPTTERDEDVHEEEEEEKNGVEPSEEKQPEITNKFMKEKGKKKRTLHAPSVVFHQLW